MIIMLKFTESVRVVTKQSYKWKEGMSSTEEKRGRKVRLCLSPFFAF